MSANTPLTGLIGSILGTTAVVAATTNQAPVLSFDTLGLALLDYQVEGVRYIHRTRRVILGDEMGLGKTFQAIAAVALDGNAYPALVVCPPALTLNWRNEIRKLVPGARVAVLTGTKPGPLPEADWYVVGDSVVAKWVGLHQVERNGRKYDAVNGPLATAGIRALVIDECHRHKSYKAQRARAAMAFAATLPADAMRVLMSGTAIVNRTEELATQIRIAGVDQVFGGWFNYLNRYAPKVNRFGSRGSAHTAELHDLMTQHFYLRRLRSEVLTLPGKGRITVATAMAGKYAAAYLRAQDDLIAYVRDTKGRKAAEVAGRAEALVLLTTLRNLVGLAKVEAIVEYVSELVEQGEQVFVAAWHQEVVEAIVAAFPGSVTITGSDTTPQKQAAVEAFQAGQAQVLVGNIIAAGVGHTLTAARHVVIAELPWTPGDLQQVEDRLDRIGQTREVVSHIMLGANGIPTVDERLMGILNDKAAVTGMVLDGSAQVIVDDSSIAAALLDSYREG